MLTEDDIYLFSHGMWQRAWEKMGAHADVQGGDAGWLFRVWAPDVKSVHVAGDFNDWSPTEHPLHQAGSSGIWEGFVPGLSQGDLYKYVIETDEGELLWKADPFGFFAETCPGTASRLWDLGGYAWKDRAWMNRRAKREMLKSPLNIYEAGVATATSRRAPRARTAPTPGPATPSPPSAAPTTATTTYPRSSWPTSSIWATPISRSCP